jgi:hypothetical protein
MVRFLHDRTITKVLTVDEITFVNFNIVATTMQCMMSKMFSEPVITSDEIRVIEIKLTVTELAKGGDSDE